MSETPPDMAADNEWIRIVLEQAQQNLESPFREKRDQPAQSERKAE